MFKADFHMHSNVDPCDHYIRHSPYQLIDRLVERGITLAGITHHKKIVFDKRWQTYAKKKGLLLLPSVELRIESADVIIINAKKDNIHSFDDLRKYRKKHTESLIVAPHPFCPFVKALMDRTFTYIDLFDALEISAGIPCAWHYNQKVLSFAKKHNKPILANSDAHHLRQIGTAFNEIPGKNWNEALANIRSNKHTSRLNKSLEKYYYLYPMLYMHKKAARKLKAS